MQLYKKQKSKFCLLTVLFLLGTIVLGRLSSYFQTISATDIAYADWVSDLMSYIGEIIVTLRTVISFSAVSYAAYYLDKSSLRWSVAFSAGAAFLDYAARFLIDYLSGSLNGTEMLALIWLLLQYVYELIFIVLAVLIILMMKRKAQSAENRRTAEKFSCIHAIRYALLLVMLSHVALEAYYLVDFLLSYTNITNTEIASIIGQFLKIFVIYGSIALLFAEGMYTCFKKLIGTYTAQTEIRREY